MTQPAFATSAEAQKHGWFSRRHQTSQAHREAQEKWAEKLRKRAERIAKASDGRRG